MSGHHLRVHFCCGCFSAEVVCREPEGANCRLMCAENCGAETYPCGGYVGDPGREENYREHELVDYGACNAAEWINFGSGPEECCGVTTEFPVSDGMPIEVIWFGDCYEWEPVAQITKDVEATTPVAG